MSEKALQFQNLGMPIYYFLRCAIDNHKAKNKGEVPKRIVIHPLVAEQLLRELSSTFYSSLEVDPFSIDKFYGTQLQISDLAKYPLMIECDGTETIL